jgi:hypothetical protein
VTSSSRERALLLLDVAAVLVFVAIGRSVHGHADSLGGIWRTSWPFLAGVMVGELLGRTWRSPLGFSGVVVWLATVACGMALRVVAGQGIAVPFVLVALGFLGLTQLGWRVVASVVLRLR